MILIVNMNMNLSIYVLTNGHCFLIFFEKKERRRLQAPKKKWRRLQAPIKNGAAYRRRGAKIDFDTTKIMEIQWRICF